MIQYRHFRNADPPQLLRLWHEAGLGRGAAYGITCDAFDLLVFSTQHFDPRGLIVAVDSGQIIGFVHAGFGCNDTGSSVSPQSGVISVIMVHPTYRRQGIGRELVSRAETYLQAAGTWNVQAGQSPSRDPFYQFLYGGIESPGFLMSDPLAEPFFKALGYEQRERIFVYHRDLSRKGEPMDNRVVVNRRTLQLQMTEKLRTLSPWWVTRLGQLDSIRFLEIPKRGGAAVAEVTCFALETYAHTWRCRAAGLMDLFVPLDQRRKAYAKTLLTDVCRRLKEEQIDIVEAQAAESNLPGNRLLENSGFEIIDTGIVYGRSLA